MGRLVYCRRCTTTFTSHAGELPHVCPMCSLYPARWSTMAPVSDEPRHAWDLNANDRRLLHTLKILPES